MSTCIITWDIKNIPSEPIIDLARISSQNIQSVTGYFVAKYEKVKKEKHELRNYKQNLKEIFLHKSCLVGK